MAKKKNNKLIASIVFASLVVAASLFLLGYQLGGKNIGTSDEQIDARVDAYIQNLMNPAPVVLEGNYADDDAVMGDVKAPVTIVEFSDYECPFCLNFHLETFPLIKENYIDTGKVKFVYRDFPLDKHLSAYPSALATECARDQAGDEAFYKMHGLIFDNFNNPAKGSKEFYLELVKSISLDANKFGKCFDGDKFKDEIANDMKDAQKAGLQGTPMFIINGVALEGAQPYSVFEAAIEQALTGSNK